MVMRVSLATLLLAYLLVIHSPVDPSQDMSWALFPAGYLIFSMGLTLSALRGQRSPAYRRILSNLADTITITYLMVQTGEAGAALFVLYLWITLGGGFRFGIKAMAISTGFALVGFSTVIAFTPFWQQHQMLAVGLLLSLAVLPAYASFLIRQLHRARARAEEANAAKSQFLARMSHELRTPLNGIRGTTELLLNSRRLTAEEQGMLGIIQESVSVSLRQIDSVLDYSRIEAGKLEIKQIDFDLYQLLHSTAQMLGTAAREKNLRFLLRISPEAPYRLIGDPHYLREVLLNLLSNAIKFTTQGYVALQVDKIALEPKRVRLRFEVRDTGMGMSPESLGRIWESFNQVDMGITRRHDGAGLGTTIAKHLVELMGGHMAVTSVISRGSVFWCELPFTLQDDVSQDLRGPTGGRALLLSNDIDTAQKFRRHMDEPDHSLVVMNSGKEAIDALGRGIRLGTPFHLVLVDDRLIAAANNKNPADALVERALAAQTPVFLVTDTPHDIEQLCGWAYAGILSRKTPPAVLAAAFRTSPHFHVQTNTSPQVVKVEPWAWGQNNAHRRRVLVADDNRTNRLILEQMLKSAGYGVDVASDGEQALEHLTTGRYRAAVLDLHMPGLDGISLLRRYRQSQPLGQRIPIVMLTADATFDARSACAEAGADAFLTKPTTTESLLSILDRLVCEREVHVLSTHANRAGRPEDIELPILDVAVLAELQRLCPDPERLATVFEAFHAEGEAVMAAINTAAAIHNQTSFAEWVHAMKGNAANVGALRLMRACRLVQAAAVLEFRRDGRALAATLQAEFLAAQQALHELVPRAARPDRPLR